MVGWLAYYLHKRMQISKYEGEASKSKVVMSGVPQGSKLGPVTFPITINKLPSVLHCGIDVDEGDTTMFMHGRYLKFWRCFKMYTRKP